ncbi:MAG: DHHA1 domain-containing protein [Polyangiaceae bacterium]
MQKAKERSKFRPVEHAVEAVYREALDAVPGGAVRFSGYDKHDDASRIVAIIKDNKLVEVVHAGDQVEVVSELTPFYGAAGGQVGDMGVIVTPAASIEIEDTHKPVPGLVVHRGRVKSGSLALGERAELKVDVARRERIRRNHSATHLLHWALRKVVGSHAQQKGSLVGPDRLRFDFAHSQPLSADEIARIETLVNERTLGNHPIRTEVLSMEQARARGAMMIFEEKYGDTVRLLSMAESLELCGGTHARATGDIGLFKIVGEQGVAAGVRRIMAVTGDGALAYLRDVESQLHKAAETLKAKPEQLAERLEKVLQRERTLEKQIEELTRKLMSGGSSGFDSWLGQARDVSGVKVLGLKSEVTDRAALRELAEKLRDKLGDSVVLVGSVHDGKAQLVLTVAKPLTSKLRAGDLIRPIAEIVGGSGGGRPDMAQAGGTDPARLDEAIEAVYSGVGALN